jgi:hypothetical protein
MTPREAHELLDVASILRTASAALVATLERLCEQRLTERDRDASTAQLYFDLAELRGAMTDFADVVVRPGQTAPSVLRVQDTGGQDER